MRSRVYFGKVSHTRMEPVQHGFSYPIYMYCLDLDELPELDRRLGWFGYNRVQPVAVHDRDYLDRGPGSLREKLMRFLERQGCEDGIARIELLTAARFFHYVFNPVSFYYCYRTDQSLHCAVAEVNNTFGERHLYILHDGENEASPSPARYMARKEFHVSPFNDLHGRYEFSFSELTDVMDIRINLLREDRIVFSSRLQGNAIPFSALNLSRILGRHPFTAWLTLPRIYREAAVLYFGKKLPVIPKPHPTSPMTIRGAAPGRIQRLFLAPVQRYLTSLRNGWLTVTFPDRSIQVYGNPASEPKADLTIHAYSFFRKVAMRGDIGFGASFMDGDWTTSHLTSLLEWFIANRDELNQLPARSPWPGRILYRLWRYLRRNTLRGSRRNIQDHYDLSNEFFQTFLDPTLTYSCALFRRPEETLEQAQLNKLHAILNKARIKPDDHVLEIGSGWGSFAITAARTTGCRITAITLSQKQWELARQRVREAGLEDRIDVQLRDYRSVTGQYDAIVSIEMIEAVGHEYFGTFFAALDRLLKPGGRVVMQAILIPDERYETYRREGDWIQKYIFPGGLVPSLGALSEAMGKHSRLAVESTESIGLHYARTLRLWHDNLIAARDRVRALGFDDRFFRMWEYYFSYCEAGFSTRILDVQQMVLTRL
ncbi:MAG: DUF1365 family protein [Candidatus Omnitrophica bacterium]|nr:DUF1365 family protein [Candidatus Omnitrophota bacterium]